MQHQECSAAKRTTGVVIRRQYIKKKSSRVQTISWSIFCFNKAERLGASFTAVPTHKKRSKCKGGEEGEHEALEKFRGAF